MRKIEIGDVTIDAVFEREGLWRRPQDFFPAYDEATFKRHLQVMEPEVSDPRVRDDVHHVSDFRCPDAASHHLGGYLYRGRQRAPSTI